MHPIYWSMDFFGWKNLRFRKSLLPRTLSPCMQAITVRIQSWLKTIGDRLRFGKKFVSFHFHISPFFQNHKMGSVSGHHKVSKFAVLRNHIVGTTRCGSSFVFASFLSMTRGLSHYHWFMFAASLRDQENIQRRQRKEVHLFFVVFDR